MIRETHIGDIGQNEHFRELTGLDELVHIARRIDGIRSENERRKNASTENGYSFTHTDSLEEAIDLCEYGWPEGRARVVEKMGEVALDESIANLGTTVQFSFEVSGDEPDIDRYLADDPENMIEPFVDPSTAGRNVKLLMNAGQHAFVAADQIERRGVVVATALDVLTTAGYGVQVDVFERTRASRGLFGSSGDMTVEYRIPIVGAGSYMNIDTLSFCLIHPSFLRRLIFALNESEPDDIRDDMGFYSGGGYGQPLYAELREGENTVVIDKDDYLFSSDDQIGESAIELSKRLIRSANELAHHQ